MPYSVTREDILSIHADAVALSAEINLDITDDPVCLRLAEAGGEPLQKAVKELRFVPTGSAAEADSRTLPFRHLFVVAAPRWLTGKANELLVLRRCYENLFVLAAKSGCRALALPFFSTSYYRFPRAEAVHIALTEAARAGTEAMFAAGTPELYALSQTPYRKPEIVSYVGYYRDHALFALDNGLYARVDLRPERADVSVIPYFEACYRAGNNPLQPPLPEAEIARLRRIYETNEW